MQNCFELFQRNTLPIVIKVNIMEPAGYVVGLVLFGLVLLLFVLRYFIVKSKPPVVDMFPGPMFAMGRNTSPQDLQFLQGRRVQQRNPPTPPPDFNLALRTSIPISYIHIEDPPPSYKDYLQMLEHLDQMKTANSSEFYTPSTHEIKSSSIPSG